MAFHFLHFLFPFHHTPPTTTNNVGQTRTKRTILPPRTCLAVRGCYFWDRTTWPVPVFPSEHTWQPSFPPILASHPSLISSFYWRQPSLFPLPQFLSDRPSLMPHFTAYLHTPIPPSLPPFSLTSSVLVVCLPAILHLLPCLRLCCSVSPPCYYLPSFPACHRHVMVDSKQISRVTDLPHTSLSFH